MLALLLILSSAVTHSRPSPSLQEIFASLPQEFLPIMSSKTAKPLTAAERIKLIKVRDDKNGYLEAIGNNQTDSFAEAQLALFRKKDGSFLVGLRTEFGDSTTDIHILAQNAGAWKDVTKRVMPQINEEMVNQRAKDKIPELRNKNWNLTDSASGTYSYVLPRKGTTIEIEVKSDAYAAGRIVLWRLPFDGEKFSLGE